jgi:2-carboxy-D-arabinitol-1-phosphatase
VYRQWQKNAANFSIDGHYPVRELWHRAQSCWERILAHEGKSVLVVAHNAVNQALVATSLGGCCYILAWSLMPWLIEIDV